MKQNQTMFFKSSTASTGLISACLSVVVLLLAVTGCGGEENAAGAALPLNQLARPPADLSGTAGLTLVNMKKTAARFSAQLADQHPFGQVEIPRIGVREWMVQGTTKESMTLGTGHIEETPLPGMGGNFGLAGDRVLYTAPFLRLDQLQKGDDVLIHMPYGDLTYRVEGITDVQPTEVSVLNPKGYDSITLSTCNPTWQVDTRMIISARLVDAESKPW